MADTIEIIQGTATTIEIAGLQGPQGPAGATAPEWGAAPASGVSSVAGRTGDVTLAVADVSGAVSTSDSRLTDSRTPSSTLAHKASHATGGTDALAPSEISAAWQQTISSLTLGNTTHNASAARNQLIRLTLTSGLGAGIILPNADNQEGDRFAVRLEAIVGQGVTIRTSNYSLVVSGPAVGRTRSFIYTSGAWVEFPLTEDHSHSTSEISGTWGPTFAVSRGNNIANGPFTFDQSWVSANTTYTAIEVNVTDAASAGGSLLQDWRVGGSSVASINKSGAGAFTTLSAAPTSGSALTLTGGTVTASAPLIDATQTWNNGAVTFRALRVNVTNTASASASLLADFQVGGATQFAIGRGGEAQATFYRFTSLNAGMGVHSASGNGHLTWGTPTTSFFSATDNSFRVSGSISIGRSITAGQTADTFLFRDDAGVLAQRNAANAQTFRIYNTFTSATNFERLNVRWASNELIIDAQAGSGGGTLRGIKIGSASTSLLGFFGATPVDRPATVSKPDPLQESGTVDADARIAVNAVIDRLQELGLIAT